ncbi:MAG TPA: hypothetical protein DEA22_07015 [Blastocatellia bacterium]|nr:hypothetical protein [Blastocatellia bacterium]
MDKTYQTQLHRIFLIEGLPEPLSRSGRHLQIFDNYIEDTRIRLRSIRDPLANTSMRSIQQIIYPDADRLSPRKFAEIHLNDAEFAQFSIFEGSLIRKNRYFHEFDGQLFSFDVFLGDLWGLNIAKTELRTLTEFREFLPPPFAVLELTESPFFSGMSLAQKSIEDVRAELGKSSAAPAAFCGNAER